MQSLCLSLLLLWMLSTSALSFRRRVYDELRLLGGACPPRDTCRSLLTPEDDHLWGPRTCECGPHCIRRNTCCIDSPHAGRFYVHPPADETCQKVPNANFEVRMVSECSTGGVALEKCTLSDPGDPLASTPVTSLTSLRTYKNYFCALCHRDDVGVFWNVEVQGVRPRNSTPGEFEDVADRLEYDPESESWGVVVRGVFQKVKFRSVVPARLRKIVKKCHSTMVTSCHDSLLNSVLHQKCLAYYAPVKLLKAKGRPKFRNVHCGLCNNASAVGAEDDVCVLDTSPKRARPKLSFALLLDVNTSDGGLVGRVEVCRDGQVMDPFFKKCRTMKCGLPNYVMKNRTCVKGE